MGLFIRMFLLYPFFLWLGNQGIEIFDPVTEQITFNLKDLESLLGGLGGYLATFAVSRYGKNFLNWRT